MTEEELRNEQDVLVRPVISNLPVAIIVVNKDRRVMLSNKAAELISGKTEGQMFNLRGGDVLGCIYANDKNGCGYAEACQGCQIRDAVVNAFKEKTSRTVLDTNLILKEYGKRDLKVSATYINIEDIQREIVEHERRRTPGRRKSDIDKELVIVAVEDVTEFRKKERLEAAMETVGAACHGMNNPLQSITGNLDLMKIEMCNCQDPSKILTMIDNMNRATDRLKEIAKQLLNLKEYQTVDYPGGTKILDVEKSSQENAP